jgi:hypothetical protein
VTEAPEASVDPSPSSCPVASPVDKESKPKILNSNSVSYSVIPQKQFMSFAVMFSMLFPVFLSYQTEEKKNH